MIEQAFLSVPLDDATDASVVPALLMLTRVGRLIEALHHEVLRPRNMDGSQLALLYALWVSPGRSRSQRELGALLVQTQSGVTRTTKRLLDRGFVSSVRDKSDGRARTVVLEPAGAKMLREAFSELVRRFAAIVQPDPALVERIGEPVEALAVLLTRALAPGIDEDQVAPQV